MSYTITLTNGAALVAIPDGSIDQTATDLTLLGKNITGYGQFIDENFVYLLENFANNSQPNNPIKGQLWFDTSQNRLKVYNGNSFEVTGGSIVSNTQPTLVAGDIWINNSTEQLFFSSVSGEHSQGWPIYTKDQGLTGFESKTLLDIHGIPHTVLLLYVSQTLIGVFSKDVSFTPAEALAGITGQILKGFTSSTLTGMIFDQVSSSANALVASDGSLKTVSDLLVSSGDNLSTGTLTLASTTPLIMGSNSDFQINVTPSSGFSLQHNTAPSSSNFTINLENISAIPSVFINSTSRHIGLYNENPQASLHIGTPGDSQRPGSVIIEGNLIVNGTTVSNNTSTVDLADYTITLANTDSPSDGTADGAGIIIAGTTNKSLLWVESNSAFTSSENIDLASGSTYKINGADVLTSTTLGSSINTATGLTSIGNLTSLRAGLLGINSNVIAYVNSSSGNGNIVLAPKGYGSVDVSSAKIINLEMALAPTSSDATNVNFVITQVKSVPLALTIPISGLTSVQIQTILAKTYPNSEHTNGTICRVVIPDGGITVNHWTLNSGIWVDDGPI